MQMNIRDIDSKNYKEMRECEVDTKVWVVDAHDVEIARALSSIVESFFVDEANRRATGCSNKSDIVCT